MGLADNVVVARSPHHVQESGLGIDPVLLGLAIGLATVGLRLLLNWASREPPTDKWHGLVREDFVWWLDWVVAAVISFGVLVLSRAHDHGSLNTLQACGLLATFILGLIFMPTFVRNRGYDTATTPPILKLLPGIVVPNVFGAVLLLAAVSSGASLVG